MNFTNCLYKAGTLHAGSVTPEEGPYNQVIHIKVKVGSLCHYQASGDVSIYYRPQNQQKPKKKRKKFSQKSWPWIK